jgi:hypothetical protein
MLLFCGLGANALLIFPNQNRSLLKGAVSFMFVYCIDYIFLSSICLFFMIIVFKLLRQKVNPKLSQKENIMLYFLYLLFTQIFQMSLCTEAKSQASLNPISNLET